MGNVDGFARSVGRRGGREKMPDEYISREAALKAAKVKLLPILRGEDERR